MNGEPKVSVLTPTFDHGPTLYRSVGSALGQTVQELEILIVGDGVADTTRQIVAELMEDKRVRFFDSPKTRRHGEAYRHEIVMQARGEIVCYLADDDLWLPDHVETMQHCLRNADFVNALPLYVDPKLGLRAWPPSDLGLQGFREMLMDGVFTPAMACVAHTMEMYARLPRGWSTTPDGLEVGMYMWQQFLSQPDCVALTSRRPTVVTFPSAMRRDWPIEDLCAEMDSWLPRLNSRGFLYDVVDAVEREFARTYAHLREVAGWLAEGERYSKSLREALARAEGYAKSLEAELEHRSAAIEETRRYVKSLEAARESAENYARSLEVELQKCRAKAG